MTDDKWIMKAFVGFCLGAALMHAFYTWVWWAGCQ